MVVRDRDWVRNGASAEGLVCRALSERGGRGCGDGGRGAPRWALTVWATEKGMDRAAPGRSELLCGHGVVEQQRQQQQQERLICDGVFFDGV